MISARSNSPLVPTIDIAPFLHGGAAERIAVADQVRHACETIGFFLVTGHDVPELLIKNTYDAAKAFFDRPVDEKRMVARTSADVSRGYNSLGDQSLSRSMGIAAPPDLQESFNIGPLDAGDTDYFTKDFGAIHFAHNRWPSQPIAFEIESIKYYRAMERLSAQIMSIFARALGLEDGFFHSKIDKHVSSLRFINYPEQLEQPNAGQKRAGEHTDYGALTILRVDNAAGGLQVQDRAGNWIDVGFAPGAFVVNIGDLMMQWTNDRWVSTLHRVVNPPHAMAGSRRLSIVYFHQPNYDAEVSCLPGCAQAGEGAKYAPTTSGAHWRGKNAAARSLTSPARAF